MNEESKNFIRLAIEVLDRENVTQDSIDNAVNYIRQAIEQIKIEKSEVSSIELNDIVIKKSEKTKQITPIIIPATAKGKILTYESGNTGFFTVDNNGLLIYINEGEDRIKVTASNGVTTYAKVSCVDDEKVEEKPIEIASKYTGIAISNDDKEMYLAEIRGISAQIKPIRDKLKIAKATLESSVTITKLIDIERGMEKKIKDKKKEEHER